MCGVFGIRAPQRDVARLAYFGLHALQHRGQESAGVAVSEQGRLTVMKDMGLVTQVFSERNLGGLGDAEIAIGHTRYSTTGPPRGRTRSRCSITAELAPSRSGTTGTSSTRPSCANSWRRPGPGSPPRRTRR